MELALLLHGEAGLEDVSTTLDKTEENIMADTMEATVARKARGFASMDKEKQRAIASKGGKAAHRKGTAHKFTSEEARAAGRKGGRIVSRDREHMARIGRVGGQASRRSRVRADA